MDEKKLAIRHGWVWFFVASSSSLLNLTGPLQVVSACTGPFQVVSVRTGSSCILLASYWFVSVLKRIHIRSHWFTQPFVLVRVNPFWFVFYFIILSSTWFSIIRNLSRIDSGWFVVQWIIHPLSMFILHDSYAQPYCTYRHHSHWSGFTTVWMGH